MDGSFVMAATVRQIYAIDSYRGAILQVFLLRLACQILLALIWIANWGMIQITDGQLDVLIKNGHHRGVMLATEMDIEYHILSLMLLAVLRCMVIAIQFNHLHIQYTT